MDAAAAAVSRSQTRFEKPRTFSGSAALSVLMLTKRLTPTASTGLEHVLGADDVRLPRLVRMQLEQRLVLQRGGVEHHLRAVLLEDLEQPVPIADVGEGEHRRVEQCPTVDRQLRAVEPGLVPIEHDQRGWLEAMQLPAQLRSDRSAGPGDEHAATS